MPQLPYKMPFPCLPIDLKEKKNIWIYYIGMCDGRGKELQNVVMMYLK